MARKAGIPLVDFFELTDRISSALPGVVEDFVGRFAVVDHQATRSPGAVFHRGKLQSLSASLGTEIEELDLGFGTLSVPLVHGGVPFQLGMARAPATGNLEPAAATWNLDLFLTDFVLTLDGAEPAIYVPETGTTPRHLLRDPDNRQVRIIGTAVLRLQKATAGGDVEFLFVDTPDPFDPGLTSGVVASVTFSPPHFFLGSSEFGITVGELLFDFSRTYSPPRILSQNQGPSWTGFAIREATVYAPRNLPGIGDLSGGVRDVLIGRPMGIQGEFEVQFGRTALDPATFQFEQEPGDANLPISGPGTAPEGQQPGRLVTLEAGQDEDVIVHAGFTAPAPPTDGTLPTGALQDWTARWSFDGEPDVEGDSATGTVRHGSVLRVEPIEIVTVDGDATRFSHPPVTFRFVAAGEAPAIEATIGSESFQNVVHLGGTAADLAAVTLTASSTAPGTSTFTWTVVDRGIEAAGATFTPELAGLSGDQTLKLTEQVEGEEGRRVTHLRVRLVDEGTLLVGCEAGVFDATDDSTHLDLAAVEATFDLSSFHAAGELTVKREQATLDDTVSSGVVVPNDGLARVTISEGAPAPVLHDRHVQVLMLFEEDVVVKWGPLKPADVQLARPAGGEAELQSKLLAWAANYPGADFLVIGRCDDIGEDVTGEEPDPFNIQLARDRAAKGRSLLTSRLSGATGEVIDGTRVSTRGETSDWEPGSAAGDTLEEDPEIADGPDNPEGMTEAGKSEALGDPSLAEGWLIKHEHPEHTGWVNEWDTAQPYEPTRETYRRIDIYAVGGTPTEAAKRTTGAPERAPTLRRSLVPAADRSPTPVPPAASNIDYRVKLVIRWDSPTATEWSDAAPTLAEAEFAWTPAELPLPEIGGAPVPVSREVLTVYAQWVHDPRTGFTRTTLGVRSDGDPEGLVATEQRNLTAALAFGPALLSGVDLEDDVIGSGARIAALLAAAAFADVDLGNGPLVGNGSKTALIAVEAQAQTRALSDPAEDYQVQLTVEYTSTVHVDAGVLGIKTAPDRPMKIRYKEVGVEFDNSKEGWEQVGLAFETSSMEIEDGGQWMIDGVLGDLLRIVEITFGRGSVWVEGRIAVALSLGLIEISEAIIRLTFPLEPDDGDPTPRFELRGFVVSAEVPGVVEGEGRLRIEDGGVIRAGVDASVIPLGLGADAALALAKPPEIAPDVFLSLFLGVQFSTPLPLAQSGAALYGFKGLFTMNGSRKLPTNPDPVGRELDWWATPPAEKYEPDRGQYALGVGVVVGTLPDVSFCFSASGMLVVAFPDPEVILGVDVKIIQVPDTTVSDEGAPEGTITGLIVIDDEAVTVAVSATYTIPRVLELKVPFSAYFPYVGEGTYVRIGSDGQTAHGRFGEPVTLTLLPGTLDARAWAYLMIEQAGLPSLGGDPRFSFDGFSVGFGAGWGIEWSAGPLKLTASAQVLVGFGTKPLLIKGGVFVNGELDLVVVSVGARGELILTYIDEEIYLDGEFCGEVDCFLFSVEGCVGISIGGSSDFDPPDPEPPVASVSLVDRRDRIMGTAVPVSEEIVGQAIFAVTDEGENEGASADANQVVWPDTAPVLHFTHYVENAVTGGQFDIEPTPSQPIWFGGNRLKYTYRLDHVVLRRKRDQAPVSGDEPLATVWMTSPYRHPDSTSQHNPAPSEHEGPNLKLLDWDPWTWVVNMEGGGAGTAGDPAEEVEDLCDPMAHPRRACVFGRAARGAGLYRVILRQETPARPPYPSRFFATGQPVFRVGTLRIEGRDLQIMFAATGGSVIPGGIVPLPFPVADPAGPLVRGYRLPHARRVVSGRLQGLPLPWEATFDRAVARPKVTLLVCDRAGAGEPDRKRCTEFEGVPPGGRRQTLEHRNLVIRADDPGSPFTLVDQVDTRAEPDALGRDGRAEVSFPSEGITVRVRIPCRQVELWFMKLTGAPIRVVGRDADGRTVSDTAVDGPEGRPLVARVNAADGIAEVGISGGGDESLLYRVCCMGHGPDVPEERGPCEDFRDLKPTLPPVARFEHGGLTLFVLNRPDQLVFKDVVDQRPTPPEPGSDRSAEIGVPPGGMGIELPHPCRTVEVHVMLFGRGPVLAMGFDAGGARVARARTPLRERRPYRLVLTAPEGGAITRVTLKGGSGEAVLYRICCLQGTGTRTECVDFAGLGYDRPVPALTVDGIRLEDMAGEDGLSLIDVVDAGSDPAGPGRDGVPEVQFREHGLRIRLPRACASVTVRLVTSGGVVKGHALNGLGARTDRAATTRDPRVAQVLTFDGPDIRIVELFGGDGEVALYEICCTITDGGETPDGGDDVMEDPWRRAGRGTVEALPGVHGIQGGEPADEWPGRVVDATTGGGRRCRVVEYEPATGGEGPWGGLQILSPPDLEVTLLSICGIDQVMVEARDADEAARVDRLDLLTNLVAQGPTERREILLDPGEEYEIVVEWSWQAWESNEDGTDSPPEASGISDTDWEAGGTQIFHFAVAEEQPDTGHTQDGLNEYVFDPRDVSRHLTAVEPADGRVVHFTGDPVWAHFDAGHVIHLLERYDRDLTLEVRRTDPPPQATAAELEAVLRPLTGTLTWHEAPASLQAPGHQRINDAILMSPCLPDGPVVGGASLGGVFDLEPEAMYDLDIVAPRTGSGDDPVVVSATRFTTSRYADPEALLDDLGYARDGTAPYRPEDLVLPAGAVLPTGGLETSDRLLDDLMEEMGADTLPLPGRTPASYAIWRASGPSWRLEGLLVDSLEPLERVSTEVTSTGTEITTRCRLARAEIDGQELTPLRANTRWTRVVLKAASPVALAEGRHDLVLELETSAGPITGRRSLSHRPAILEREGLE